jgi:hypothetical protein
MDLQIGDFNGDSVPDLAVTSIFDSALSILIGNGDGTFEDALLFTGLGNGPSSLKIVDMNKDGISDVLIALRDDAQVLLMRGGGTGGVWNRTFPEAWRVRVSVSTDPYDLIAADFNNDGITDFATTSNVTNSPRISVRIGSGNNGVWTGGFTSVGAVTTCRGPTGLSAGHFNADNRIDIAVACGVDEAMNILYGTGGGSFVNGLTLATGRNPMFVTVSDLDGDTADDIVVANQFSDSVSVFFGNGDGSFEIRDDYPAGDGARASGVALFNNDALPDLIVSNWQEDTISLLAGVVDPVGSFIEVDSFYSGDGPSAPIIADFNGDGILDVAVASRGADSVALLIGYCQ